LATQIKQRGLQESITFDVTLCRDISYYTGIVFEAFAPGVGAPILLGGRYDDLLAQFGEASPAIGCAIEVERTLAVLGHQADVRVVPPVLTKTQATASIGGDPHDDHRVGERPND
jgi:ATP phosphoribosyltransferase regulatory subunit HisZ